MADGRRGGARGNVVLPGRRGVAGEVAAVPLTRGQVQGPSQQMLLFLFLLFEVTLQGVGIGHRIFTNCGRRGIEMKMGQGGGGEMKERQGEKGGGRDKWKGGGGGNVQVDSQEMKMGRGGDEGEGGGRGGNVTVDSHGWDRKGVRVGR